MKTRLRELRATKGLSQTALADQIGKTDRSVFSKIESGKRKLLAEEAIELAEFFGVSVDYLLGVTDRTLAEEKRMLAMFKAINDVDMKLNDKNSKG